MVELTIQITLADRHRDHCGLWCAHRGCCRSSKRRGAVQAWTTGRSHDNGHLSLQRKTNVAHILGKIGSRVSWEGSILDRRDHLLVMWANGEALDQFVDVDLHNAWSSGLHLGHGLRL